MPSGFSDVLSRACSASGKEGLFSGRGSGNGDLWEVAMAIGMCLAMGNVELQEG